MAGKSKRTTHRSTAGKKLYAVRDKKGALKTFRHTREHIELILPIKARQKENRDIPDKIKYICHAFCSIIGYV